MAVFALPAGGFHGNGPSRWSSASLNCPPTGIQNAPAQRVVRYGAGVLARSAAWRICSDEPAARRRVGSEMLLRDVASSGSYSRSWRADGGLMWCSQAQCRW